MGLFGSYLKAPITAKDSEDGFSERLRYGASSMQGWRTDQEDAHNCIPHLDPDTAFFAVYDGHGGADVAIYTAKHLPDHLTRSAKYGSGHLEEALVDTFLDFDAHVASPEAAAELQRLAHTTQERRRQRRTERLNKRRAREGNREEAEDEDEDDAADDDDEAYENVAKLYREAEMPLEEVIQQYTSVQVECVEDAANTDEVGCSSRSRGGKTLPVVPDAQQEAVVRKEVEGNKEASGDVQKVDGVKVEDVVQEKESHQEVAKTSDNAEKTVETKQQNGDVSRKGKGKALMKTKGVVAKRQRPQRTCKQLYQQLLAAYCDQEEDNDEEEDDDDDEEDQSFQGPAEGDSSDEDVSNAHLDSDQSSEESDGSEEDDGSEEGDDDEAMERYAGVSTTEKPGEDSGCTAVAALLRGNQLLVANAGDSRCVVCQNGKAIEMSFDHKPEDKPETDRVEKAGGTVNSEGRIQGGLNVSRAIGDHKYKKNTELSAREQMITALPDVKTLTITPDVEFIVLACDGIWNSMSSQEVVDFVRPKVRAHPEKLSQICEELFDHCLAPDTDSDAAGCDNMTAVIVEFTRNSNKRERSPDSDANEGESAKCVKTDDGSSTA